MASANEMLKYFRRLTGQQLQGIYERHFQRNKQR